MTSIPQHPYGNHAVGLSHSDSELPKLIKKQTQQETTKNTSRVTLAIPKSDKITPHTETSNQSTESSSLNISEIKKDTPRTGLAKLANVTEALLKKAQGLEEENRDLKTALKAAKAEQKEINKHQKDVNRHLLMSGKDQRDINDSHQGQITTLKEKVKQQKEVNKHQIAVNNEQTDFSNNQKLFNAQQVSLNDNLSRNIYDLQHGQVFLQAQATGQQINLNGLQAQVNTQAIKTSNLEIQAQNQDVKIETLANTVSNNNNEANKEPNLSYFS